MAASGECTFLGDEGCTVYEDRPAACRYYAQGNMAVRKLRLNVWHCAGW